MQRYHTEDERRKEVRANINRTIYRRRRRKRIIRRLKKAAPSICIGLFALSMGYWCIAAPLPDPDTFESPKFQAENGQWYTQDEYDQMCRERDAYHQQEQEEAEALRLQSEKCQEEWQRSQEEEWKAYQEQTTSRNSIIGSLDFDADDAYLLQKIAMAEAEGEDTEGKALVMLVVLNRVWSDKFPGSIEDVILQKNAFTPVSNGRYDRVEPDEDCAEALNMITFEHWDESQGALYFEKTSSDKTWHATNLKKLFEHGAHTFYTEKE